MKNEMLALILAGGQGTRLGKLTQSIAKPAVQFGGRYRIIDFALSNCANSGIHNVYGIFRGQNIRSVFDHIRSGREWGLNTLLSHYFLGFYNTDVESQVTDRDYYEQILTYLRRAGSDQTIYMSCDILCNIDLQQVIHLHNANNRDITVVYKKLAKDQLSPANDILEIDESDMVSGKPSQPSDSDLEKMSTDIYVINTPFLIQKMEEEAEKAEPRKLRYLLRDLIVEYNALAFEYTGYLANITSVKSYYKANMDMLDPQKFYSLLYSNQKVYTKVKNEEATYFADSSVVKNAQLASGSVVKGEVRHSILSRNCYVGSNVKISDSIVFPKAKIGEGAVIEYAIIDKSVSIAPGVTIRGTAEKPLVIGKNRDILEDVEQ